MNIAEIRQPDSSGRVVLRVQGRLMILPLGVRVADMGALQEWIVGARTPATTYGQTIHFNTDVLAALTIECVVHECVHAIQERRMGPISYRATYGWQCGVSLVRDGVAHIHEDHIMEVEARRTAKVICSRVLEEPIDVGALIAAELSWGAWIPVPEQRAA